MPKANTTLNSMIEKLHIRCIHKGCEAVVTLEQLERHENQCPKMEVEALKSEISQLKKVVSEMKVYMYIRNRQTKMISSMRKKFVPMLLFDEFRIEIGPGTSGWWIRLLRCI